MKKWKVSQKPDKEFLDKFSEINPITLGLLFDRGITEQTAIEEFLSPKYNFLNDPFLFSQMEEVVEIINNSIKKEEKIIVYGDYDADGVTSSVVLVNCLRKIGAKCDVYIPDRAKEGYSLNKKAVNFLAKNGAKLIITVDCGISSYEEIELAKEKGIKVIVTDHHHVPKKLPDCPIINPHAENNYPFKNLAGVGVAFKLVQALLKRLGKGKFSTEAFEKWLLDLVAIGTIADCVPLVGENRVLTKFGLMVLNKTQRYGLRALIEKSASALGEIDSQTVSFRLSPRINAAGRMNHASIAYNVLISNSLGEANKLVEELNNSNLERQRITERIVKKIISEVGDNPKNKIIISLQADCPVGIVGLVSGRITDFYNRPSFVATKQGGKITGSGRSIPKFNIINFLEEIKDFFSHFGGHTQACGFTLKDENLFSDFKKKVLEAGENKLTDEDLISILNIGAEISLSDINWGFFNDLEKFAPFGQDNIKPLFLTRNLKVLSSREVGQNGNHLKIFVNNHTEEENCSLDCIGFGLSQSWRGKLKTGDIIDLVYQIDENRWNGNRNIQLKVVDLRHSK